VSVCITLRYLSLSIDLVQSMGAGTIVMGSRGKEG
jgi:hypothetical protein